MIARTPKPTPYELWRQADGDAERYVELMKQHGHIIDRKPGDDSPLLPCGWPERQDTRDPLGILTNEQWDRLHDDLTEMARKRRRAEVETRDWPMA